MRDRGAHVLDVCDPERFALAHLRGALNVFGPGGRSFAREFLDGVMPIVIVAVPGSEPEVARQLVSFGSNVLGFLEGGIEALYLRPNEIAQLDRVTAPDLCTQLVSNDPPVVLDMRSASEIEATVVPGSLHVPLARFRDTVGNLDRSRSFVVVANHDSLSSAAASHLSRLGFGRVADLIGGSAAWSAASADHNCNRIGS